MTIMNKVSIAGSGGGEQQQHVPVEASDTLHSRQMITAVDLIGEGEIGGLVDGAKSIYLNNIPLVNADGLSNFTYTEANVTNGSLTSVNVPWEFRSGGQSQDLFTLEGYDGVEVPHLMSSQVKQGYPVMVSVNTQTVDAVRLTVTVPALMSQDSSTGDTNGSSVSYSFDVSTNGGSYSDSGLGVIVITGKTRSHYQRTHLITLPKPGNTWSIRMNRITADSTSSLLQNDLYFDSYSEITNTKLSYPNSAMVAMRLDSQQFSSVPTRSYLVDGLYIKVPTNYDAATRVYTGVWDGTFKVAVSSNPAWVLYDLLTSSRYGLGKYVGAEQVDKAMLYTIGRYCDELVSDGYGGFEPRFSINTSFQSRMDAYKLISDVTSVFRGMSYWNGGMVSFTQDSPTDPSYIYNSANVVDGIFQYTGSALKDRHSVVLVTWNDPLQKYQQQIEYVEDVSLITQFGVRQTEVVAVGCTSRGQAHRVGKWILLSEQQESEMITYKVGIDRSKSVV